MEDTQRPEPVDQPQPSQPAQQPTDTEAAQQLISTWTDAAEAKGLTNEELERLAAK